MGPKDLANLPNDELKTFFDSFDNVLCDCDGVIYILNKVFDGVSKSLASLKKLGKSIKFVTNNTSTIRSRMVEFLAAQDVFVTKDDICSPTTAIIDYLRRIKFDKKVYLISLPGMRNEFLEAGIQIANDDTPDLLEITPAAFAGSILNYDKDVGAVVVCFNFNMTYTELNKAHNYISNPDILFITSASDRKLIIAPQKFCLGPGFFHDILRDASGRKSIRLGKPHEEFKEYIQDTLKYVPERTLFVGDSLEQDISFAKSLGYKTLLVMSGNTTSEELKTCDEQLLPDYYISGLGDLHKLIPN